MNLPNKLTVFRAVMVPAFLLLLLWDKIPMHFFWADLLFSVLSLTDMLDGKIARKRNLVTNFGKFLDPLADKVLVISALLGMTTVKNYNNVILTVWIIGIIIIVTREFAVSGLRLVCVEQGKVIAANVFGKIKTTVQLVSVIVILLTEQILEWFPSLPASLRLIGEALFVISVLATVISGIIYIKQNADGIGEY